MGDMDITWARRIEELELLVEKLISALNNEKDKLASLEKTVDKLKVEVKSKQDKFN